MRNISHFVFDYSQNVFYFAPVFDRIRHRTARLPCSQESLNSHKCKASVRNLQASKRKMRSSGRPLITTENSQKDQTGHRYTDRKILPAV